MSRAQREMPSRLCTQDVTLKAGITYVGTRRVFRFYRLQLASVQNSQHHILDFQTCTAQNKESYEGRVANCRRGQDKSKSRAGNRLKRVSISLDRLAGDSCCEYCCPNKARNKRRSYGAKLVLRQTRMTCFAQCILAIGARCGWAAGIQLQPWHCNNRVL